MTTPEHPAQHAAAPLPQARSAAADRLAALLTTACALLLGLLAAVSVLALHLHFESRDRDLLHAHLQAARALLVRVDNTAAIRLYESFGFFTAGVRKNYYQASGMDAYTMTRPKKSERRDQ